MKFGPVGRTSTGTRGSPLTYSANKDPLPDDVDQANGKTKLMHVQSQLDMDDIMPQPPRVNTGAAPPVSWDSQTPGVIAVGASRNRMGDEKMIGLATSAPGTELHVISSQMTKREKHEAHMQMIRRLQSQSAQLDAAQQKKQRKAKKKKEKGVSDDIIAKKFMKRAKKAGKLGWQGWVMVFLICTMLVGLFFGIVLLLPNKPKSGDWRDFGPRWTMKVYNDPNAVYLAISRLTAYMMYGSIILVFFSKAHSLRTWIFTTQIRLYLPYFERLHDVHIRAGWIIFLLSWIHSVFHVIRWARLQHLHYLYSHQTGVTGCICWLAVTIVSLPMGIRKCRRRVRYEIRKTAHTWFAIAFGVSASLHAPATNILIVIGIVTLIYLLDWLFSNFVRTYEVRTCHFHRLQDGVVLVFENPEGFSTHEHGYVNICIPFISKYEWHAISIYPHSHQPNHSSLCILINGDWTRKLHKDTIWKTTRPVWIQGPFVTPFAASVEYDNVICVSSGSGISASLAAIHALKSSRRVNFIWLCRDASCVQFYLETYEFDTDAYTIIYYTGKQRLALTKPLPPTVLLYEERPQLRSIVCMIVQSIESDDTLPEEFIVRSENNENQALAMAKWYTDIGHLTDPHDVLKRRLRRAMNNFKKAEIVKIAQEQPDPMSFDNLENAISEMVPGELVPNIDAIGDRYKTDQEGQYSRDAFVKDISAMIDSFMTAGGGMDEEELQALAGEKLFLDESEVEKPTCGSVNLKRFIGNLDDEKADGKLKKWVVLYCGGGNAVSEELQKVCNDFDIKYDQEKFDW